MTALLGKQSLNNLVSLRIHGVSSDFLRRFREAGYSQISADDAVSLRIHGVDPEAAAVELRCRTQAEPGRTRVAEDRRHSGVRQRDEVARARHRPRRPRRTAHPRRHTGVCPGDSVARLRRSLDRRVDLFGTRRHRESIQRPTPPRGTNFALRSELPFLADSPGGTHDEPAEIPVANPRNPSRPSTTYSTLGVPAATPGENIEGRWLLDFDREAGRLQLTIRRSSHAREVDEFLVLPAVGLSRPVAPGRKGGEARPLRWCRNQHDPFRRRARRIGGSGRFEFAAKPEFEKYWKSLGYSSLGEDDIYSYTVHDVSREFLADLRSLGYDHLPGRAPDHDADPPARTRSSSGS